MTHAVIDDPPPRTLGHARRDLASRLAAAGREPAVLDARRLIEYATGFDHAQLLRDDALPLDAIAADRLETLAARRLAGEPLSRILGERAFHGMTLVVQPDVLDPREDSETLVELALTLRPDRTAARRVLDLGTGSGALLCALFDAYPQTIGVGLDRSISACRAAQTHVGRNGFGNRGLIVQGDWSAPLGGTFDLIVSNPPYIASGTLAALPDEVRKHDPALALDGGADGLDCYRAILADIGRIAAPGALLVLEIGAGMRNAIADLLSRSGLGVVRAAVDSGGHERAIAAEIR